MEPQAPILLICDCDGTMKPEADTLGVHGPVRRRLCRDEIETVREALKSGQRVVIGCAQEAPLFAELAEEEGAADHLVCVDLRDRAGWSEESQKAAPKMAALIAEALIPETPVPAFDISSEGRVLILGEDQSAIEAAQTLDEAGLDAALVLFGPAKDSLLPAQRTFAVWSGQGAALEGHVGAFRLTLESLAPAQPWGRGPLAFGPARAKAALEADLVVDLRRAAPFLQLPERRDGYFKPELARPGAVEKALTEAARLTGVFEKPKYLHVRPDLCAHKRNGKTGCTRCLDACPVGALSPKGDAIEVDPYACDGFGHCASLCPTGALSLSAPSEASLLTRLHTLLSAYRKAGGKDPALLLHDARQGADVISALARFGKGLPARVLPFALRELGSTGLPFLMQALAWGANRILALDCGQSDTHTLDSSIALVNAMMSGLGLGHDRVARIEARDPAKLETCLYPLSKALAFEASVALPTTAGRAAIWQALRHIQRVSPAQPKLVPLPAGAPFGRVAVDVPGCTLCLSCVGACPTRAFRDDPDKPRLSFIEELCIQCGLCRDTCPPKVIRLEPRLSFESQAREAVLIKEEEPLLCPSCGKPFGVKSSLDAILQKMAGHPMFKDNPQALERLKLCEDCRVLEHFKDKTEGFDAKPSPLPRTSNDS